MFESLKRLIEQAKSIVSPKHDDPSGVWVVKDKEGHWHFLGIYSNKYEDRDSEILSSDAHKEYATWLKATGFQPSITFYHQPSMPNGFWSVVFDLYQDDIPTLQKITDKVFQPWALGKATKVTYLSGFTFVVGSVYPDKYEVAERLSMKSNMGMSHGFIGLEFNANIFDKYRSFEMSVLRSKRAANLLTLSGVRRKESDMAGDKRFDAQDRIELVELFTEESVQALEAMGNKVETILDKVLSFKDKTSVGSDDMAKNEKEVVEKVETPETPTETPAAAPPVEPQVSLDSVVKAIDSAFGEIAEVLREMQTKIEANEKTISELKTALDTQETTVKAIQKTEDEKMAELITARNWRGGYSASQDNRNVVKENEKEELLNTSPANKPAGVDEDNPLALAFKGVFSNLGVQ